MQGPAVDTPRLSQQRLLLLLLLLLLLQVAKCRLTCLTCCLLA
jgi:hypothetical protein